jgi:putative NIF3 family GTP cyclohydrolase 1 type 2
MTTVADIVDAVDRLAPFRSAEPWDNVGLLLGDAAWPVRRVLVCLDVSEAVCREAARRRADLVLAHHPLLFQDVDRLTSETRHGRLALALLESRRAVIAAHTNLDGAPGGLCDILAGMVGLRDLKPLRAEPAGKHYKVVVFTPPQALSALRPLPPGQGGSAITPSAPLRPKGRAHSDPAKALSQSSDAAAGARASANCASSFSWTTGA